MRHVDVTPADQQISWSDVTTVHAQIVGGIIRQSAVIDRTLAYNNAEPPLLMHPNGLLCAAVVGLGNIVTQALYGVCM